MLGPPGFPEGAQRGPQGAHSGPKGARNGSRDDLGGSKGGPNEGNITPKWYRKLN